MRFYTNLTYFDLPHIHNISYLHLTSQTSSLYAGILAVYHAHRTIELCLFGFLVHTHWPQNRVRHRIYFFIIAKIFPERLQEKLWKYSHHHSGKGFWNFSEISCVWFGQRIQTFPKYFSQVWSNIYWNISGKLPVKIHETSHRKSFRNFSAQFLEIFRSRTQAFQPIFPQPCRNISQKTTINFELRFALWLHGTFPKLFWNILFMVWTEDPDISWNVLASLVQYLLKYFRQAFRKDTCNLTHKILQKLFCKGSRNIQISVTSFSNKISPNLQKYFPRDYKKCCVKIPTIITRKVADTFPKYFVYGLDREHNISWNVLASLEQDLLKYLT